MGRTRISMWMALSGLAIASGAMARSDDAARALAAELVSDAASRTSALAAAEGDVTVKVGGNMQFRYYANFGSDKLPAGSEDFANGFQTRRTRLNLSGQIGDPKLTYKVEGDFSKADGEFRLLETWGEQGFDNGWSLRVGQFKIPLLKEELISHTTQQAAERSTVSSIFTGEYSQGLQISYKGDSFRFAGSFNDGIKNNNIDFTSASEADYALTGRVEYKFSGDWKQFDSMPSWKGSGFAAMIGGAVHWQDGGSTFATGTGSTADSSTLTYTIDGALKGDGWNAFGTFVGRRIDDSSPGGQEFDDFGFLIQGGLFFTDVFEGFARYSTIIPDGDRAGDDLFNELTLGVNYYFIPQSHAAKFTADFTIAPDATTDNSLISTNTNTGIVATTDSQYFLRAQVQIVF